MLGVALLDELWSGVPTVAAHDLERGFDLSHAESLGLYWLVPGVTATVVEPGLFLLADRYPRRWFVTGGLFALGAAAVLAACAPSAGWMSAAITLAWLGSGAGVTLSEASLSDLHGDDRAAALARWSLAGEVGDLLAPALLAAAAWVELGWRSVLGAVGALLLVWSLLLLSSRSVAVAPDDAEGGEEGPSPTWRQSLREALGSPGLMRWLAAASLCDLLDEIVVVFATLRMRGPLGFSAEETAWVVGAGVAGALAGAAMTPRALERHASPRILLLSALGAGLSLFTWLLATSPWADGLAFFALGATVAPMYPIASANAYAAMPKQSGAVNAARHVFTPLMLATPWLLGWLADTQGLVAALAMLFIQPLGLGLMALHAMRSAPTE